MSTNIQFSKLDDLIENWIFETDKEVTTFKKLENYIKFKDLKISANEENVNIFHLHKQYLIYLCYE